eukprot:TRINITY_DN56335_c0_g1_i1.p1 TRINITY_DN56335_c0_g1~~TRINITY_DN56335_c0_g1_i1.p1  ORF type:complete len:406 (+),score=87.24 TRINITY_DN56335_c0_g1_i1:50-1219(+)
MRYLDNIFDQDFQHVWSTFWWPAVGHAVRANVPMAHHDGFVMPDAQNGVVFAEMRAGEESSGSALSMMRLMHAYKVMTGGSMPLGTKIGITVGILLVSGLFLLWLNSLKAQAVHDDEIEAMAAKEKAAIEAKAREDRDAAEALEQEKAAKESQEKAEVGQWDDVDTMKNLMYVGVARVEDRCFLARYSTVTIKDHKVEIEKTVSKLLAVAKKKMKPGAKDRLVGINFHVLYDRDAESDMMLFLVTTKDYPERFGFQLLRDLAKYVTEKHRSAVDRAKQDELTSATQPKMQELLTKYENPKTSKEMMAMVNKMDDIKSSVKSNLNKMQANDEALSSLQANNRALAAAASNFNQNSSAALWKQRLIMIKQYCLLGVVIVDFVSIYVIWNYA